MTTSCTSSCRVGLRPARDPRCARHPLQLPAADAYVTAAQRASTTSCRTAPLQPCVESSCGAAGYFWPVLLPWRTGVGGRDALHQHILINRAMIAAVVLPRIVLEAAREGATRVTVGCPPSTGASACPRRGAASRRRDRRPWRVRSQRSAAHDSAPTPSSSPQHSCACSRPAVCERQVNAMHIAVVASCHSASVWTSRGTQIIG